ncbi:hypothetical protein HU200_013991 [Digitaria exilis]|uniref:Reticulon-like protein n=1 Tax=Digitaria exilis TaxID=1010633 RepID=A0A835KKM1_9POAL|nr:hypothetical protein HU200_013991 [Digitaria exilis]
MATTMNGHGSVRLFGRERTLHEALGGHRGAPRHIAWTLHPPIWFLILADALADIILWRDKTASAAILAVATVAWWLFEVAEFHFLTLVCYVAMIGMLRATRQAIQGVHRRLSRVVEKLYDIACGKDIKMFILAAVIADCFSSLTLFYLVVLGTMTLPALYERYDSEVDHLVARGVHDLRTHFSDIDSGVLRKIPRGTGASAPK